ncbi:unnamed protein product [Rotaria sordida]|uniref:Uncharacterized protein n=1 Tax=Rotaria sordida TaxID=392033 RepID=A0A814AQT5_9BILA|nr:unnamed protein product [Rotaria sordida]CAF0946835.1 unnamed protein product [Rotaria sordida]CAF0956064.1 unnamed protein product [Rotaria sordida]CAF3702983.1 unnamed protein product [Rotaria sordida]
MDQSSSITHDSSISLKFAVGFGVTGLILIILLIIFCCRKRKKPDDDHQSDISSIESFEQLYFSKVPFNQIENIDQRIIERWSSIDRPSITFYRVHMPDYSDNFYQPVTEKRLHSSIQQSKAMEYIGLEMNFF